jgi:hypothetical protein
MLATYVVALFAAGFSAFAAFVLITTVNGFDNSAK